jgi:hypothetical protein
MKTIQPIKIDQALVGYTYSLANYLTFKITLFENYWHISQEHGFSSPIKLMSGEKIECVYPFLEQAQYTLQRVFDYYYSPLTRAEIRHWFNEKWLRREEERDQLRVFKQALLDGDFKTARKLYNEELSGYSKEAIPEKVIFQLELTNT